MDVEEDLISNDFVENHLEEISKGEKYFREASYKIDGTQWV